MKHFKSFIITLLLVLTILHVSSRQVFAEGVSGSNFILGVDVYYYDYDREYISVRESISLTANSAGTGYTGSITQSTQSGASIQDHYLYRYVFVLDNNYVGAVTFNAQVGSSAARTYFINGDHFEVVSETYFSTFTITTENLKRSGFDTWVYPIESFNVCSYMLNNHSDRYYGINHQSDYMFPMFRIKTGDKLFSTNVSNNDNWIQTYIFFITASNTSGSNSINSIAYFNANFTLSRGECLSYKTINRYQFGGELGYLCQVTIGNYSSSGVLDITYTGSLSERYYMPVYCNSQVFNKNVSTDFALIFGMSNQLLDDLHALTQATSESASSVDSLDDQTDQFAIDSGQLMDIESSYGQDFNDQLNNIDFTNPLQNNPNFLSSASFMVNIFNSLILNNPLSIFIVIICIVLIAKKVFGK